MNKDLNQDNQQAKSHPETAHQTKSNPEASEQANSHPEPSKPTKSHLESTYKAKLTSTHLLTKDSYAEMMKGHKGLTRIYRALGYSWDGLKEAYRETGFRQLLLINTIAVLLTFLLPFSLGAQLALILVSGMSIVVELINCGLEAAVDHTSQEYSLLAKLAKDVGSAAQYCTLALGIVMWIVALVRTFF